MQEHQPPKTPAATANARRTYHSLVRNGRSARSSSRAVRTVASRPCVSRSLICSTWVPTALGLALATGRRVSTGAPRYSSSAWIRLRLAEMNTGETMARTMISRPANTAAAAAQTQTAGRAGGTVFGAGATAATTAACSPASVNQ